MCGAWRCAPSASRLAHFSTTVTTSRRTGICAAMFVATSMVGPYSRHPASARTSGTSRWNSASTASRLPSATSIVAMTWITAFSLLRRHEAQADGRRGLDRFADKTQPACLLVNAEDGDRVPLLVADQQVLARRFDREVARHLDRLLLVPCRSQLAAVGIDPEDRDAVVTAVGAVQELARRMHHHLRRRGVALETFGECGDRLSRLQGALLGAVVKGGHGRRHLVDDIGVTASGMERELTRARSGRDRRRWRVVWRERALVRVEAVDEDLVEAKICRKGEVVGGIEVDRVPVRPLLPARVGALALVLDEAARLAELAVLANRQAGNTAAAVVRHQDVLARPIHDDVAGTSAARGLLIEQLQLSRVGVEGEGADRAALLALEIVHFADCIQEAVAGVQGQERRVRHLHGDALRGQLAAGEIQLEPVDPLALAACVGADVDPQLVGLLCWGCRRGPRPC